MNLLLPFDAIDRNTRPRVGGKAYALAEMKRAGLRVPDGVAVVTDAYESYVTSTGLRERVLFELNRKPFSEMRWEELWDAALRVRSLFLSTDMPAALYGPLYDGIEESFGQKPVVVRSSALAEDSAAASFAGLHESYVNVVGAEAILDHVRLVWASLWSDRALLYRQELGLDVERSAIAVVVQELVLGERSGVAFSLSPMDEDVAVIEAVHGLNQALVDGTVEPDHWTLARDDGRILSHTEATREQAMTSSAAGAHLTPLAPEIRATPPLDEDEVTDVYGLARRCERHFGSPQDVEWTYAGPRLWLLQSRPITSARNEEDDSRRWYLGLTRSFENLQALWRRIEDELLPTMDSESARLAKAELADLSDVELLEQIADRGRVYQKWKDAYWEEFIPFAHGARLFGQVYNDAVRPEDPFEFTRLLAGTSMISLDRNRALERLASVIREDVELESGLRRTGKAEPGSEFEAELSVFIRDFSLVPVGFAGEREGTVRLLLEMASRPVAATEKSQSDLDQLRANFLNCFDGVERGKAQELLELGRASYRLRDNDNIHLRSIENEWRRAVAEAQARVDGAGGEHGLLALELQRVNARPADEEQSARREPGVRARQLLGQPAGPGIAAGRARVLEDATKLFDVQAGEILVCDAVDPNMTFVVPLAAGIIERRGGMLIHGAIIAREYGLPCVTGVADATALIETGDTVTVDGYLGIVTISR